MNVHDFLAKLSGVRASGDQHLARCPAHDDRSASLSIREGDDGRLLVHCHAGCTVDAIVAALGLTTRDLFPAKPPSTLNVAAIYDYQSSAGDLLYQCLRLVPKSFRLRRPDGAGGWIWKDVLKNVRLVVYQLPRLHASPTATRIFVVEGEKDCDRLWSLDVRATCAVGGAGKWKDFYVLDLKAAGCSDVVVLPDRDDAGAKHALDVAASCAKANLPVRIVALPDLPPKGDVSDWLDAGHDAADLHALVEGTPLWEPGAGAAPAQDDDGPAVRLFGGPAVRQSQASKVVESAVKSGAEFFHTPEGDLYVRAVIGHHRETMSFGSKALKRWLSFVTRESTKVTPSASALADAMTDLAGRAQFDGETHPVFTRIARVGDEVFLDLGRPDWDAVHITPAGWTVEPSPDVRFRRARGLEPLPIPVSGGSLSDLARFLNVPALQDGPKGPKDFALIGSWLVGILRGRGPYAALALVGEQGSAKTFACSLLRRTVDPNSAPVRLVPNEPRDLMIAATNSFVVSFDNLSSIKPWLSDCLCALASGTGFSARELFSDADEALFTASRPILLNGITDIVTRPDLLDRTIVITLDAITDDRLRRLEAQMNADFEAAHPGILGALCDATATALANEASIRLERPPRMADFAAWVVAAEPALPWKEGTFLAAYAASRHAAIEVTLEGDSLSDAIREIAAGLSADGCWEGTPTELLDEINRRVPMDHRPPKWFKRAKELSGSLRRLAPGLRHVGVSVTFSHNGKHRVVTVKRVTENSQSTVNSVTASDAPERQAQSANGGVNAYASAALPLSGPLLEDPNETDPINDETLLTQDGPYLEPESTDDDGPDWRKL